MRHYCTLFDRNYLDRGVALYRSLERHAGPFKLHVLCLDAATEEALGALRLQHLALIGLDALQGADAGLAHARGDRGLVEFYFTCKPVLLAYILSREADATRVEYLDSDLYFFASPSLVESAYAMSPVALSPHRFDPANAWRRQYGEYNAGWVSVAATPEGRRFVQWWRERCLESCSLVPGGEIFGDQKYLDRVPGLFPGAASAPRGVNAGPWNIAGGLEGQPLVCFHFHGVRRMLFNVHESGLHDYGVQLTSGLREAIYQPYVSELADVRGRLSRFAAPPSGAPSLGRALVRTARALLRHSAVVPA